MTGMVRRLYVEKRPEFAVEAQALKQDLVENLGIRSLEDLRILHRYDVAGLTGAEFSQAAELVFSEPPVDVVYDEAWLYPSDAKAFAMEYLPGQYDQRADSAEQCVQLITQKDRPKVVTAKVILLYGKLSAEEVSRIQSYCINPVESRLASLEKPESLEQSSEVPADVAVLTGFCNFSSEQLQNCLVSLGLAMSAADLAFCQTYFKEEEHRDPTLTEIKVLDTYWSDHCRHTTFQTEIEAAEFANHSLTAPIQQAYERYQAGRRQVYGEKLRPVCLMDIALMAMKELKQAGDLKGLDESEEINACSIVVPVTIDGKDEEWLVMFKNETHNHPTEIEPFGGAATCLGGAIRDPLSGRSYVYQAMRVTGSGDPRTPVEKTLKGKLPQRKITLGAASGYSSYGNQIGLATGQVTEVYDAGYVAKRMEVGAVIAAAPRENVVRERPATGDCVLLIGGRTGRDGCGGATGSSKAHTDDSLANCGAEVQKGNAPTERAIQRLFRRSEVSRLIKRCNDFGAGGVSVAVGELTDSLDIDLDRVLKKYDGLDGTELAISESQERMAVVVAPEAVEAFIAYGKEENLEVTPVAVVTTTGRLVMKWRGQTIVNLQRSFLDTNGVRQKTTVKVAAPLEKNPFSEIADPVLTALPDLKVAWLTALSDLNVCSQKGLAERFDSTIGRGTVLMPFGGKNQLTPTEGMVAKLPVRHGETDDATAMTFAYYPKLATWSPFHGALYAVVASVAKIVALGGDAKKVYLTLQEYFEKLGVDAEKWGKPFSALLGAYTAQQELGVAAIGGKDSMSGTFEDLTVPPTLVSFAVAAVKASQAVSAELKGAGHQIIYLPVPKDAAFMPDFTALKELYGTIHTMAKQGQVLAAMTVREGGLAAALSKMSFGNQIGLALTAAKEPQAWFQPDYGAFVLEVADTVDPAVIFAAGSYEVLGQTTDDATICLGETKIALHEALTAWEQPLAKVFPAVVPSGLSPEIPAISFAAPEAKARHSKLKLAKPQVLIPLFPGTNCEVDSAQAFERAGANTEIAVIRNLQPQDLQESLDELVKKMAQSQIIMFPGGFSAGDEPDGSGKFIATLFRSPKVAEAVDAFLAKDGLILGICNGFQALIKLGLLPYGKIQASTAQAPTLTYNRIGRHMSSYVQTKITSKLSPWFALTELGEEHTIAISHGEGRFIASPEVLHTLAKNGQIATQYVDATGQPAVEMPYNPNGSLWAIEGITSPDGRILGKMGHSERRGSQIGKNVPGSKDQKIFESGVAYFS
ncbi:MAG: phosphoribosylformylglycinamidine synthase [Sporomusaceae bacterium]|nr:phosphoribosylformylglycinamidine synthase [Sporomusaceae bacterium]